MAAILYTLSNTTGLTSEYMPRIVLYVIIPPSSFQNTKLHKGSVIPAAMNP